MDAPALCLHCERHPRATRLDLCLDCAAAANIRLLYVRRRGWTPEWEQHLRRLTERAKQRLPLFGPDLPEVPARRRREPESPESRLARRRRRVCLPAPDPGGD